jgi:phage-related minor tail protein
MAGKIKGITIEIGGDTQKLNKALEDVNKKTRDVQSELRQVERLLKLDPGNTDLLAQKQKLLAEAVENSREKLNRLKTAQEQVNEQFAKGEINEEQYRAFQREVAKAEQELKGFERQLNETAKASETFEDKLNKALEDVNKKSKDLQSELEQVERLLKLDPKNTELLAQKQKLLAEAVENSREKLDRLKTAQEQVNEQFRKGEINEEQYRAFQREVVKAEQELKKFEKQLRETGLTAEKVGQKLKDAGQKMTDIGKDLSLKVTAPIVAAGGAAFKMAADLQDAFGATEQVYKSAADAVKNWADSLPNYYGIAEGEALEYANMMGSLLQNIGDLTEEQAAKQAQTLIELAGDLAAMYGGAPVDAVRALTGALKGNNSMLDNYGMAVNEAIIKTKAMEMGLVAEGKELDLASKQAATLALIMEQTADAQGQAAREAEGASGSMRSLSKALKDLATSFGEILLPVITPFIAKLNELLKQFKELSPETQKTIIAIAAVAAAIGPLLTVIGKVITVFGTVMSLVSKLSALLPVLGGAFTVLTGPIGLVIAALGALVAAGVAVYKNWDIVKYYGLQAWGNLKIGVLKAIDAIAAAYEKLLGWIPSLGSEIRNVHAQIRRMIEQEQAILESRIKPGTSTSMADFRQLDEQSQKISDSLKGLQSDLDDIVPSFDSLGSAASGAGGKMSAAAEKSKTVWTGTADAIKTALSTLQTMHETEMVRAEMAGDNVEILRLKYRQLSEELEGQKAVVAATRAELEKATAAGVQEGETAEDLAKRIDELNKKLADEERAQAQLEKQVHDTREAMKTQAQDAKKLAVELKTVAETYYSDLAKALEEYQTKVKETNENLLRETEKLKQELESKLDEIRARGIERERQVTEQFQRELENRTRALINFVGLFDEVTRREVSGETLLKNLQDQVRVFEGWQENIAELAARGLDAGLLQELREMGPKAAPEIAALLTLTDAQLQEYASLWRQKQEQAREEATAQLAQQREEMNRQLYEIRRDTANQLEQQRREVAQKLQDMQAKAKEELEKYKKEWEKKNEEIRKNTEKNIQDIHKRFQDLVGRSTNYGIALMDNFMAGIDSQMPALIARMESIAGMIDSYMPHSPAKRGPLSRIMEWGPALVSSLSEGIKKSMPQLEAAMRSLASVPASALAGGNTVSNYYNNDNRVINITVQDGEDLLRTLHRLGVRLP